MQTDLLDGLNVVATMSSALIVLGPIFYWALTLNPRSTVLSNKACPDPNTIPQP